MNNSEYMIFTSSLTDILAIKTRALQLFALSWRYLFEIFSLICTLKYQYIILNNNLKVDLNFRIYSQVFSDEQIVFFKKIGSSYI